MLLRSVLVVLLVGDCASGAAPELHGLSDQTAAVGRELVVDLDGTDADGDILTYGFSADIDVSSRASVTRTPAGAGVFRWTPIAADIGLHSFDFTASDGSNDTTVTITIDVRAATGAAPIFREPLGTGEVVDLGKSGCTTIAIAVDDEDTVDLDIAQEAPVIDGAQLTQIDGRTAVWDWCPTPAQIAQQRFTLILSADDHDNPKTILNYVLVLRTTTATTHLVINEVDYDQVGTDGAEFIEIYNPGTTGVNLSGLQVVLVNGSTSVVYDTIDLASAGTLGSHGFLVVGGATVSVAAGAKHVDPGWTTDRVQNGAPDGVALVDTNQHAVVDVLSYEGSITAVTIANVTGVASLVEGTALPTSTADSNTLAGSLCRASDGQDIDDAAVDWVFCQSTPGAANVH